MSMDGDIEAEPKQEPLSGEMKIMGGLADL